MERKRVKTNTVDEGGEDGIMCVVFGGEILVCGNVFVA
jgi:hypothetical protein